MADGQAHRLAEQLRVHPDSTRLASEPVRTFASAGTLSAEPNLAERSRRFYANQEPLRDPGGHGADRGRRQRPRRSSPGVQVLLERLPGPVLIVLCVKLIGRASACLEVSLGAAGPEPSTPFHFLGVSRPDPTSRSGW